MVNEIENEWQLASLRMYFDVLKRLNPKDETLQRLDIDKLNPEKMEYWNKFKTLLLEMKDLRSKNIAEIKDLHKKVKVFSDEIAVTIKREKVEDIKKESPFCGWLNNRLNVLLNYLTLVDDEFNNEKNKEEYIKGIEKEVEELGGIH